MLRPNQTALGGLMGKNWKVDKGAQMNIFSYIRTHTSAIAVLCLTNACGSSFHSIGSTSMQAVDKIDVTCEVVSNSQILAARLRFVNSSDQDILVKRGIQGYGLKENKMHEPGELHADEYLITSGGVTVPYVGIEDIVLRGLDRTNFSPVRRGEVIAVRFSRLDDSYKLLPGTHTDTLHHIHLQMDSATGNITEHKSRPTEFTYTKR